MSHPCCESVEVEYRRDSAVLFILDFASCKHIVVDETVRIDHLIHYILLNGIGFDAELDRLHHKFHIVRIYKRNRGVSESTDFRSFS